MANKNKHGIPRWLSITAIALAVILALTLVLSLLTSGMRDWSKFKIPEKDPETPTASVDDGAILTPGEETGEETGNRIALTTVEIPRERYEDYGIMTIAETAYTVTATVSGESLTEDQKNVTWSAAAFKNPSSSWASGKSVATYVTATPS